MDTSSNSSCVWPRSKPWSQNNRPDQRKIRRGELGGWVELATQGSVRKCTCIISPYFYFALPALTQQTLISSFFPPRGLFRCDFILSKHQILSYEHHSVSREIALWVKGHDDIPEDLGLVPGPQDQKHRMNQSLPSCPLTSTCLVVVLCLHM